MDALHNSGVKIPLAGIFKGKKIAEPSFLYSSMSDQRENFALLNEAENRRISEALDAASTQISELSDKPVVARSVWDFSAATSPKNVARNRYSNVFPWNKSRVKLGVVNGASDYINASYVKINDDAGTKNYIACQGPLPNTGHHFWSMAWHESEKQKNNTVVIVMVTPLVESGVVKCHQYWPTPEKKRMDLSSQIKSDGIAIDDLIVEYVSEEYNEQGDYLLTKLHLHSGNKVKDVFHYYYYKWADAKVPPAIAPLVTLSQHVHHTIATSSVVPIVHCSAGVGRTGTFIAIDHLFRDPDHLAAHKSKKKEYDRALDPIYHTTQQLRECRMMMVQTVYQYNFLYDSARALVNFERKKEH